MIMLDAAALAAILDPERKVTGWWDQIPTDYGYYDWVFTGPATLHTAREHCWRMEEWLEARGIGYSRLDFYVAGERKVATRCRFFDSNVPFEPHPNHAAALNAAIERISNG